MITKFADVFAELKEKGVCKRLVAAWAVDEHTIVACAKASELGFVKVTLVGDKELIRETCQKNDIDIELFEIVNEPVELKAVSKAVQLVHDGEGDVLMKGLCSTDKFLRAIHKLLFLSDMAVIPLPDFRQKVKIAGYLIGVAKSFGISKPKLAFIAASEQVLDSMPACMEAAALAKMVDRGQIKGCVADGPLALDVAIDKESVEIKKLVSPVAGDADCLEFPNIESANVFWKTNSKLATGVKQAGMLVGTTVPCVLASRADSVDTKLNSIAEAVMFVNK